MFWEVLVWSFGGSPFTGTCLMYSYDTIEVMDCWKEDHPGKMPFSSHRIKCICCQPDSSLLTLTWAPGWGSVRFLCCKITSPPPYSPLQKEVSTCSPHFRGELCFTSLRTKYLYKLSRIPLHKRFVPSPPFIYSTLYLYHHGFMSIYFVLWVITQHVLLVFLL